MCPLGKRIEMRNLMKKKRVLKKYFGILTFDMVDSKPCTKAVVRIASLHDVQILNQVEIISQR